MKNSSDTDQRLLKEMIACETGVWNALVAGDQQADNAALADDFIGIYPDGFAQKDDHLGQLAHGPTVISFALSNCRVRALGKDHALFMYRADFLRAGQADPQVMYVSSIWQRTPENWTNIFSQDTPAVGSNSVSD